MPYELIFKVGIYFLEKYIKSSETKKDDKVLEVVQIGAKYLAPKTNNTLSTDLADELSTDSIRR